MKVIVLGAGLVGAPIAIDLALDKRFTVSVCDTNASALEKLVKTFPVNTIQSDLSKPESVKEVIEGHDAVINAVPGFMGFNTLRAIIEAKKDVVDIAFFPEDPFQLDELAKKNNVTAVVDCGVAPGMSNILTGHAASELDEVMSVIIYVGGLPEVRQWPYEYKAVFSPVDVIEEYTRPARYIENGKLIVRPALSDPELIDFPGIGTLEAFNTDGLRTMAKTIKAPNLKEKTLRYPGHIEKMALLRDTGFFSKEAIEINGHSIIPLDFTAKLLFPKWKLLPGETDLTVMQVRVEGMLDNKKLTYLYYLLDRYDKSSGVHSMARVTGYTATMTLRLIADGLYLRKGIIAPEFIGESSDCVRYILHGLRERGVNYRESIIS